MTGDRSAIEVREVTYVVDDRRMIGRLATPEGHGPFPAVLIAHEGTGLDELQAGRADRLAELGFVAFSMDYHGGGEMIADRHEALARLDELFDDPNAMRTLGRAGLEILLAEPTVDKQRVAAIGYCFGGAMMLELARSGEDLKAVVGFHAGLRTKRPEDATNIRGSVLVCIGSEDTQVPLQERLDFEQEMRAAGVDWQINVYGGAKHCFTHPWVDHLGLDEFAYDKSADLRSWSAMLDLFDEVLG